MPGFACKGCGEDLTFRIDLFVRSLQSECEEGEYPPDMFVAGRCHECNEEFEFSGPMFTNFVVTKAKEGIIGEEASEYKLVDLAVTEEEYLEFLRLIEEDDEEELEEFLHQLVLRGRIKE